LKPRPSIVSAKVPWTSSQARKQREVATRVPHDDPENVDRVGELLVLVARIVDGDVASIDLAHVVDERHRDRARNVDGEVELRRWERVRVSGKAGVL